MAAAVMAVADIDGDGRVSFSDFVQTFETNPDILDLPVLAAAERIRHTEASLSAILAEEDMRRIAMVFVHLDKNKNGVLDYNEVHSVLFSMLKEAHPAWEDNRIEGVVRRLFDAADRNNDGTLDMTEFIASFATKHYVLPPEYIEETAGQLKRSLEPEEVEELRVLFRAIDVDNDGMISKQELHSLVIEYLQASFSSEESSADLVVESVIAVADLDHDGMLSFSEFSSAFESDTTVLDIPIMAAVARCEVAHKRMEMLLCEHDIKQLSRVFVHLDEDNDGLLAETDLHGPVFTELRKSHPDWASEKIEETIHTLIVAADTNCDGRLSLDEFIGAYLQGNYVLPPTYVKRVALQLAQPLTEEETLQLKRSFERLDENQDGFVSEEELRAAVVSAVGKAQLSADVVEALCGAIMAVADDDEDRKLSFGDFLRCYQLNNGLLTIPLVAIADKRGSSLPRRVTPSSELLRGIGRCFVFLDKKKDGLLDFEEIKDELLPCVASCHQVIAQDNVAVENLAKAQFAASDLDNDGKLSLDEFVATFVNMSPLFPLSYVMNVAARLSPRGEIEAMSRASDLSSIYMNICGNTTTSPRAFAAQLYPAKPIRTTGSGSSSKRLQRIHEIQTRQRSFSGSKEYPAVHNKSSSSTSPASTTVSPPSTQENDKSQSLVAPHHAPVVLPLALEHRPSPPKSSSKPSPRKDSGSSSTGTTMEPLTPPNNHTLPSVLLAGASRDAAHAPISDPELKDEFRKYDKGNLGYLDQKEFRRIYADLENYGLPPSKSQMDAIFKCCKNADRVTYDEFCIIMLRRSRM